MIETIGIAKYFGRFTALRNLSITIPPGQFVALFGRNGAGKTTFLRILAGLTRPSSGDIRFEGFKTSSPHYLRGALGYLSHNTALYGDLTALENLRFYAELHGLGMSDADLEAQIARVGLKGRGRDLVRNYSRGMQQRLAIARAFIHDPEVYLLDEPFTGLDQAGIELLKEILKRAHARGKTCIMAIHDPSLGYELGDRMVIIDKGVVALDAKRKEITLEEFQRRLRSFSEEKTHAA